MTITDINARLLELADLYPAGSVWEYYDGGCYKIIGVELNATSYEENGHPDFALRYEQLYDGLFPKGQIWVRSVKDFTAFVDRGGQRIQKFSRMTALTSLSNS